MISILFWNTRRGVVGGLVAQICASYSVDVVVLAEEPRSAADIFPTSFTPLSYAYDEYNPVPSTVRFFVRNGRGSLRLISDGRGQSLREYSRELGQPLLIAGVHLPSKLHADNDHQYLAARQLRRAVETAETHVKHDFTIVIGDMNMSPYEPGMSAADGLHGIMDKRIVQKGGRTVRGEAFSYFYNPMWSRLGDESLGPSGTYYSGPRGVHSTLWHTFDQALIRPSLIPAYTRGSLEVLTDVGGISLLSVNKVSPSDHLPVLLRLDL